MDLCLINNRPFISISYTADVCGIAECVLMEWLFDPELYSAHFVKLRGEPSLYVDSESLLLIVKAKAPRETYVSLESLITAKNGRRSLTQAQKQEVAAQQGYKCAHCEMTLRHYEIDHIEEHALRANDARTNLEALCPECHRLKTVRGRLKGDALFEPPIESQYDSDGKLKFSKYFQSV